MPNLFFYVGTLFLREDGSLPTNTTLEGQYALRNMLPSEIGWEQVWNTHADTAGRPLESGRRRFTYSNNGVSGGSLLEGLVATFKDSSLQAVMDTEVESTSIKSFSTAKKTFVIDDAEVKVSDSSGRIPKAEIDPLIAELVQRFDGRGGLFSVADCNSFHNAAYVLGSIALHRKPAPVLVVNVDQHKDMGKSTSKFVASDTWGTDLLTHLSCGAYMVLGSGGSGTGNQVTGQYKARAGGVQNFSGYTSVPKTTLLASGSLETALTPIFQDLQGDTKLGGAFQSVYITVDRDCMKGNWTQWGERAAVIDGYQKVIEILTDVMKALTAESPGVKLVGMDITGLPEYGCGPGSSLDLMTDDMGTPSRTYRHLNMRAEITAYHDFFSTWANRSQQSGKWSSSEGLRCVTCGKEHGAMPSSFLRYWHRCTTCRRVYCSQCGAKLLQPSVHMSMQSDIGKVMGPPIERTRICEGVDFNGTACEGETELIS